jgi:hypothetical protein
LKKLRQKEKMSIANLPDWNAHGTDKPKKKFLKASERTIDVAASRRSQSTIMKPNYKNFSNIPLSVKGSPNNQR